MKKEKSGKNSHFLHFYSNVNLKIFIYEKMLLFEVESF